MVTSRITCLMLCMSMIGINSLCAETSQLSGTSALDVSLVLEPILEKRFDRPLVLVQPKEYESTGEALEGALIAEQEGKIYQVRLGIPRLLVDLSDRVSTRHNEEGLLGMALSPWFAKDQRLFIYYSASRPRRSVIAEMTLSQPSQIKSSLITLMEIPQPYGNHNGGALAFGPDQALYVGLGDGGAAGDPHGYAQKLESFMGKILRLDVSQRGVAKPAQGNPFVRVPQAHPEIWAYGLRNPWRMSFDRAQGELWVGDVGQDRFEEVDIVRAGDNLGWKWREGKSDYQDRYALDHRTLTKVKRSQFIEPVAIYSHREGTSITGGYVYRGQEIPKLVGHYVYADFVSGRVWAINADRARKGVSTQPQLILHTRLNIASFAEDADGELYVLAFDGKVYRLFGQ